MEALQTISDSQYTALLLNKSNQRPSSGYGYYPYADIKAAKKKQVIFLYY